MSLESNLHHKSGQRHDVKSLGRYFAEDEKCLIYVQTIMSLYFR